MKTATVGLAVAKNKLSELVDRVARGEEIIITRHDQAVARLVPARGASREEASRAVERLRALRHRTALRLTTEEIVTMKNTGRP